MLQTSTNISSKYCQKTRYNYVRSSVFGGSDCFFLCSQLLCYRFVTTALTAQIPTETLSQSHRLCFIGKERDSETSFSYSGARYYDSDILTGWLSVDPMADKYPSLSPYAYCAWNPVKLVDPDGEDARIFIKKNEDGKTCIRINSTIYFESENMSKKDLNKLVKNATWEASRMLKSKEFDDYRVEFDIEFKVYNGEKKLEGDNTFRVDPNKNESSNVKKRSESLNEILLDEFVGNVGYINSDITNSIGRSQGKGIIHETLHFLGISDRYRNSTSLPGFENDIMGADVRYSNKVHDAHYKAFINTYRNSAPKDKPYILLEKNWIEEVVVIDK